MDERCMGPRSLRYIALHSLSTRTMLIMIDDLLALALELWALNYRITGMWHCAI